METKSLKQIRTTPVTKILEKVENKISIPDINAICPQVILQPTADTPISESTK